MFKKVKRTKLIISVLVMMVVCGGGVIFVYIYV